MQTNNDQKEASAQVHSDSTTKITESSLCRALLCKENLPQHVNAQELRGWLYCSNGVTIIPPTLTDARVSVPFPNELFNYLSSALGNAPTHTFPPQ